MTEKKVDEIKISDEKTIDEINAIQSYIKSKGIDVTHTGVVQACIRLAKRLSAENWGVYLEVKRAQKLKEVDFKETLKHVTDAEITLDILDYINGIGDEEIVDAQRISDELGYRKEKVEEVIGEIFRRSENKK